MGHVPRFAKSKSLASLWPSHAHCHGTICCCCYRGRPSHLSVQRLYAFARTCCLDHRSYCHAQHRGGSAPPRTCFGATVQRLTFSEFRHAVLGRTASRHNKWPADRESSKKKKKCLPHYVRAGAVHLLSNAKAEETSKVFREVAEAYEVRIRA